MSPAAKGWAPVYRVVKRVPAGRVATYGQIAALSGMPGAARQVGWALNALGRSDGAHDSEDLDENQDVPWHRVINAKGEISLRGDTTYADFQRSLLEAEGVEFGLGGRVNLEQFAWRPRGRRPSKSEGRSTDQTRGKKKKAAAASARRKA